MPHQMSKDTIPIRKRGRIESIKSKIYLRASIVNLPGNPLEVLQFSAGHSNLTYQIKIGDWEAVLRRPPLGPVAPKAHDMEESLKYFQN